jgi:hypothetical protein
MYNNTDDRNETAYGVHLPSLADPMVLLDQLEQRLDHCESVVTEMLADIQSRLDTLENDVRSIRADMGGGRLDVEKDLVSLSERISRLEGKAP